MILEVYRFTKTFPKEELYRITAQIRRAAVSIPTNIVEGWTRRSTKEYLQFLNTALVSCTELEYLLKLAARLGLGNPDIRIVDQTQTVIKMLRGLIKSINSKQLEARP